MSNFYFTWTPEAHDTLRRMTADGRSAARIADVIGCTRNAVIGKWNRLKIGPGHKAPASKPDEVAAEPAQPVVVAHASEPAPVAEAPPAATAQAPSRVRKPRAAEIKFRPVTLADLGEAHCRFIAGPVDGAATLYCGAARAAGASYCAEHSAVCNGRGTPGERGALYGLGLGRQSTATRIFK